MRKILVRCECGQEMQTPRSSIGKSGTCLACGRTMQISTKNTTPIPRRKKGGAMFHGSVPNAPAAGPASDARRRFGQAVDLYRGKRFAEALAVFDGLAKDFPGDPDIENGREECIKAMKMHALPQVGSRRLIDDSELDEDTVRRVVLDKLLHGESDDVQLRAAELACAILGIDRRPGASAVSSSASGADEGSGLDTQGELDFGDLFFSALSKQGDENGPQAAPAKSPVGENVDDEDLTEATVEDGHSDD